MASIPLVAPIFPAGREPLPPGFTEEDRANMLQAKKYQAWMTMGMESCLAKTAIAGGGGECARSCRASTRSECLQLSAMMTGLAQTTKTRLSRLTRTWSAVRVLEGGRDSRNLRRRLRIRGQV